MFADDLDRLDRRMRARVDGHGAIRLDEEPSRWGAYQVGALARRVGVASDHCPTCSAQFIDHAQYKRHRATCGRRTGR